MVVPGAPQPSRAAAGRGPLGLRSRRGGLAIRRAARGAGARGAGRGAAAGADQHAPWRPREGGNGLGGRPWETGGLPRGAGAGCAVRQGSGLSQVSWEGPEGRSSKYRTGIHLMAGRVPQGADRAAVRGEMETVFLENLKYAAGVLAQENLVGMLEPINTRITDPQYFLDTPQQGHIPLADHGWEPDWKHQGVPAHRWACTGGTGSRTRGARQLRRAGLLIPVPAAGRRRL
ncbi:putative hydroxypyruvate isomerase isoform X10 [Castor canadensis]|uniref:Hydroxypyruvate isomerase isoform X10 n=1 Tax=Castor canadensis TaxID=51338 RepID=A0AC58N4C1_CASCN